VMRDRLPEPGQKFRSHHVRPELLCAHRASLACFDE
jgi:hypothetical protein